MDDKFTPSIIIRRAARILALPLTAYLDTTLCRKEDVALPFHTYADLKGITLDSSNYNKVHEEWCEYMDKAGMND